MLLPKLAEHRGFEATDPRLSDPNEYLNRQVLGEKQLTPWCWVLWPVMVNCC